jgi:hypothetical protein
MSCEVVSVGEASKRLGTGCSLQGRLGSRRLQATKCMNTRCHGQLGKTLLEPTRCLLEHGADAKAVQMWRLDKCRSLAMFKLLAEFGHDYNALQHNILQ